MMSKNSTTTTVFCLRGRSPVVRDDPNLVVRMEPVLLLSMSMYLVDPGLCVWAVESIKEGTAMSSRPLRRSRFQMKDKKEGREL